MYYQNPCLPIVCDIGLTLCQHRVNASYLLGMYSVTGQLLNKRIFAQEIDPMLFKCWHSIFTHEILLLVKWSNFSNTHSNFTKCSR